MSGKEFYKDMSHCENIVAGYLNDMGFEWFYQQPIFLYDERKRPRVWTPDFYLPAFQIYVEVCGSKDFEYSYRESIYHDNGVPVVFLHLYKDKEEWQKWLRKNILELDEERHKNVTSLVKKLLLE